VSVPEITGSLFWVGNSFGIPVGSWKDDVKIVLTSLGFWVWAGFNYRWSVILNLANLEVISSSAE